MRSTSTEPGRPRRGAGWVDFRLGFQPAFDGLRGVAIATVMVFHGVIAYKHSLGSSFLPGSYLGVEVFFVQSGFLITSLLLEEWYRTGSVLLHRFYARRALRLLPALFLVAGVVSLYLLTFSDFKGNRSAWREVWASLLYVQNWFNALKPAVFPFYLNHAWSLSIEEQFYLVAPVLLLLGLRCGLSARALMFLAGAATLASALWMAVLAHDASSNAAFGRAYYGTDTRAQGLLVGVTLACALHAGVWLRSERSREIARWSGWAGAAAFVMLLFTADIKHRLTYQGLFLVCGLAVAGMLSEVVGNAEGLLARACSWRPLQAAGRISYGLYLWHWPVMVVMLRWVRWPIAIEIPVQIAIAFVVASASFRFVERPILRAFSPRVARITPEREARHTAMHTADPPRPMPQ